MTRWVGAVAAAAVIGAASMIVAAPAAPARALPRGGVEPELTITSQTPFVARDGELDLRVAVQRPPVGAQLRLAVHEPVVSRGELATTIAEGPLRSTVHRSEPVALAELPVDPRDRSVPLTLGVRTDQPPDPGRATLRREGTYPVEVQLLDADGREVAAHTTFLVLLPPAGDTSPPLAVAVVAEPGAVVALRPDGTRTLPDTAVAQLAAIGEVLAGRGNVPITLAPVPETLEALAATGTPTARAALDALAAAADRAQVVTRPYVEVDRAALLRAGLDDELTAQLDAGRESLARLLDAEPDDSTVIADRAFDERSLDDAADRGAERALVRAGSVEALPFDAPDPARWFEVGDDDTPLAAVEADNALATHLDGDVEPALAAQRVIAELAALWFERPAIDRGVALVVPDDADAEALALVLDALAGSRIARATTLTHLFERSDPLEDDDGSDDPARRELDPRSPDDLDALRTLVPPARALLASYQAMVGPAVAADQPSNELLLASQARGLGRDERRAYVDAVSGAVDAELAAVTTNRRVTVTLTARSGTIPITLRNAAPHDVTVAVAFDSDKLEFPDGTAVELTLPNGATRVDIRVRTLASGAFPLDIAVQSPDGEITIAESTYTVRSTAVSGVGLVLSLGAGAFLAVWWARHWHDARRSRRLIDSRDTHPTANGA